MKLKPPQRTAKVKLLHGQKKRARVTGKAIFENLVIACVTRGGYGKSLCLTEKAWKNEGIAYIAKIIPTRMGY